MLLGCPTKRIWPSVYSMPLIASGAISLTDEQAKYPFNSFDIFLPNLSEIGYDLFSKMLSYDQRKRISARAVLRHEYFYSSPYPKEQAFMPTYPTNVRTDNPSLIFSPIYFPFIFFLNIFFHDILSYPTLSYLPLSYHFLQFTFWHWFYHFTQNHSLKFWFQFYPQHGESVAAVSGKGRGRKYEREYDKGTDSEEKASKKSTFAHEKDELLRVARGGDNVKKFLDSLDEAKEEGF